MYVQRTLEIKAQAIDLHNAGVGSRNQQRTEYFSINWFLQYSTPQSIAEDHPTHEVSKIPPKCMRLTNTIEIIRLSGFLNKLSLQRRLEFALTLSPS